jgi:hypothetical protein
VASGISAAFQTSISFVDFWRSVRTRTAFSRALLCLFFGLAILAVKYALGGMAEHVSKWPAEAHLSATLQLFVNPVLLGEQYFGIVADGTFNGKSLTADLAKHLNVASKPTLWELILVANGVLFFLAEKLPSIARLRTANPSSRDVVMFRAFLGLKAALGSATLLLSLNRLLMVLVTWPSSISLAP